MISLNHTASEQEKLDNWPWKNEPVINAYEIGNDWPKISIVTPSFNQGQYIEQTILSVINQGYPNLEYIIIDGGSTDETVEIIKRYEPWITFWISEPDRGQSHAINKGLEKCTGEIFNWLNSDDWYLPYTLFEVAKRFKADSSLKVVSGYENHISLDNTANLHQGTCLNKILLQNIERSEITQPSTFFNLSALRKIGPVPEDMHYIMDGELWVRFLLMYGQDSFYKLHKPLVNFRLHNSSKTVSNSMVNNFLFERSSIITDLQRFVGVPSKIIDFWIKSVYQTPRIYLLNRAWQIDEKIIKPNDIKLYFIKKYINRMFQAGNIREAYWGINQLFINRCYDLFALKSILKLFTKTVVK
jgi:glycosyltransferase involved in cell wall biosynthesis